MNLIGGDDDIPGVFESEPDFMINLEAGTYFLVSSTWGAGQMGIYTWTFTGPGDLLSDWRASSKILPFHSIHWSRVE